jgi:hypothetical protein
MMINVGDTVSYMSSEGVNVGHVKRVVPCNKTNSIEIYPLFVPNSPEFPPPGIRLNTWRLTGEVIKLVRVNKPAFLTKGDN